MNKDNKILQPKLTQPPPRLTEDRVREICQEEIKKWHEQRAPKLYP